MSYSIWRTSSLPLLMLLAMACHSQTATTNQPCNPQPPCLPAKSQAFGFSVIDKTPLPKEGGRVPFQLWLDYKGEAPQNYTVNIHPLGNQHLYYVEFLEPGKLSWEKESVFSCFLKNAKGKPSKMKIVVEKKQIECCPQFVVSKIFLDNRRLCSNCSNNLPVQLGKE